MSRTASSSELFLPFGNKAAAAASGKRPTRLYVFAHAGGSARTFAPWARLLAPDIEVIGVEFPGHGSRMLEAPLSDVHEMAAVFVHELQVRELQVRELQVREGLAVDAAQPWALYGHSLGASIAYEAARLLASHPIHAPGHLLLGAMRAPHLPRTMPSIAHLPDDDFLRAVQESYGGVPEAVLAEPELLEIVLPALRADFIAYETYTPASLAPLSCPMTVFAGMSDPIIDEAEVAAWSHHTSGPFQMHALPGDHFFLGPCREQVLGILRSTLHGVELARDGLRTQQPQ